MAIATRDDVVAYLSFQETPTDTQLATIEQAIVLATGLVKRYLKYDPEYAERTEYIPLHVAKSRYIASQLDVQGNSAVLVSSDSESASALQMKHIPIRSIGNLYIDSSAKSGSAPDAFTGDPKVEGSDYWVNYDSVDSSGNPVCLDGLLRSYGLWTTTPGSIKVTYTAGYTNDELRGNDSHIDASPIWAAILAESSRLARSVFINAETPRGFTAGPLGSERLGDYSYTLADGGSIADRLYGMKAALMSETRERLSDFVNYGYPTTG